MLKVHPSEFSKNFGKYSEAALREPIAVTLHERITHTKPLALDAAIEIPLKIKQHLNLDANQSWIIIDDVNQFSGSDSI